MTTDTLGNLTSSDTLHADCIPCGRRLPVTIPALIERYGADCQVTVAMARIVCGECGRRATVVRGGNAMPGGPLGRYGAA